MVLKGIVKINDKNTFRVSLRFYDEGVVTSVFGEGKKEGDYLFFESSLEETRLYEKFNQLLREMFY